MARKVIKTAQGPFTLEPQKTAVALCMCGLSKNQPFCDGSHLKTIDEKEGELYEYDENGVRTDACAGCGAGCCGGTCGK